MRVLQRLCIVTFSCFAISAFPEVSSKSETEKLHRWLDSEYFEELSFEPLRKAFFGIKDDGYGSCGDYSEQGVGKKLAWVKSSLAELEAEFDRAMLDPVGQDSFDLWRYHLTRQLAESTYRRNQFVLNQGNFAPYQIITAVLTNMHSVDNPGDFENFVSRIESCSKMLGDLLDLATYSSDEGVQVPYFVFDIMLPRVRGLIAGAPFNDAGLSLLLNTSTSHLDRLLASEQITQERYSELLQKVSQTLLASWLPANRRIVDWMENEKKNAPSTATGASFLPRGKEYYAERLSFYTTTDLSAKAIHKIGVDNVELLLKEIQKEAGKYDLTGSGSEILSKIAAMENETYDYKSNDADRERYLERARFLLDEIKPQIGEYFYELPAAQLVVRRVEPNREQAGGPAHYFPPSRDGVRPGVFYAHLIDMDAVPRSEMETVVYHEGYPGHHLQNAIAAELSGLPLFRTVAQYGAYGEGWGLYAEVLAGEMRGTYGEVISKIGHLSSLLFRAARLVVDTGLHEYGWTEQKSIDYLMAHTNLGPVQARTEVRRYIVDPGQATSYFVGMQKFIDLRAKSRSALGDDFDLREFHAILLNSGQMPLELVERRVDAWINSTLQ